MAHFAKIDSDNKVIEVVVVPNEQEHRGQEFLANDLGHGGTWIQTSYNTRANTHKYGKLPFRKNFAKIGGTYDPVRDAFIPPKPVLYPSWILNEDTCTWTHPIPYPADRRRYVWNESIVNWTLFPENGDIAFGWSELTYSWVFKPQDGKNYFWNRRTYTWDLVPEQTP